MADGEDVLVRLRSVPVSSWNYLSQNRSIRHMGPMAQDFYEAFGLGESELLINTVGIDGVTLSAVKALDARTTEQQVVIASQRELIATQQLEIAELRTRLDRLEAALKP
jgi:hypothetical protein